LKIALQDKRTLKYVCAENGGDDAGIVNVNRDQIGPWETLIVWQLGDGFVALETDQRRFLSLAPKVGASLTANRCRKSDGQTHREDLRTVPDDVVSLAHDAWESFKVAKLDQDYNLVPVEGGSGTTLHLEARGNDFMTASGERMVLNGIDGFFDLRIFRDGGEAALLPHLQQAVDLGFTVRRVWSQGSKAQNHGMDMSPTEPGYYDSIRPYVDFNNAHGIIPLLTAFVDNQGVRSPREHWTRLAECVRGSACLLSGFNQWSKNKSDFGPDDLANLGSDFIWSRGSDVDDTKTPPHGAPASELHSTRISFDRSLMDAAASPINMRQNGSTMVWMTEGIPADQNSDPFQYWQLGRVYATCWALAVFHNRQTQAGQLMSGRIAECAKEWSRGMRTT
jgi:hypothetical protein